MCECEQRLSGEGREGGVGRATDTEESGDNAPNGSKRGPLCAEGRGWGLGNDREARSEAPLMHVAPRGHIYMVTLVCSPVAGGTKC